MATSQVMTEMRRTSSIEGEPRTLSMQQLRQAREAALYILDTKTIEEAITIFTEGLQPVLTIGRSRRTTGLPHSEAEDEEGLVTGPPCLKGSALLRKAVKDIVSSPF